MTTRLILIRHGQTDWNAKKIYCGHQDIGLNALGRIQAARLRPILENETINKIYCSNKKRAIQTARIIFKKAKIRRIAELREMHFGVFEGKTYRQILKKYPDIYCLWLKNPFSASIPEGESLIDFRKRVVRAIKQITAACPNQTIAIVCHGGVIAVFLSYLFKTRDFWKLIPKPATCTVINYG
ncbi:MAG: histidine phosphatase family protein [Candidatus Omnitrophota bacterium]